MSEKQEPKAVREPNDTILYADWAALKAELEQCRVERDEFKSRFEQAHESALQHSIELISRRQAIDALAKENADLKNTLEWARKLIVMKGEADE